MHAATAAGSGAGLVFAEHESQQDQEDGHIRELHVDILIALHAGLLVELVVDGGQGHSGAVGSAEAAAEETCEPA